MTERTAEKNPTYRISRFCVSVLSRLLFRVRVLGLEKFPIDGPLIVASNHIHNFDPPVLGCMIPRYMQFMAKSELFETRLSARFFSAIGAFPVKRGEQDRGAIRTALGVTKAGGCLAVFPEGHRSKTGQLGTLMPGAVFIAKKAKCPIIPVAISGKYQLFKTVTMRFGEPFVLPDNSSLDDDLVILREKLETLLAVKD